MIWGWLESLQFTTDYERTYNTVRSFTLLNGERAAVGAAFGLSLFDTRTGERLRKFQGHTGTVWAVSTSPDGRYLLSAGNDQTLRVWDPDPYLPLLSLFFAEDDWVAWTPEGYYAASPGGERLMGWQLNNGPDKLASFLPASQFRPTFYRPDVIKLLLKTGSVERALAEADTARGRMTEKTQVAEVLPPSVLIASPEGSVITADSQEITVRAVAQQVGRHPITSMQLLLDGRPLGGKAGIKQFATPQDKVTERFFVPLEPGVKHTLQVRADSAVSYESLKPTVDGKTVGVKVRKGDIIAVRLHNGSKFEAAASVLVDGLTRFALADNPAQHGGLDLVVPGQQRDIKGYFRDGSSVDAFRVGEYSKSVAAQKLPSASESGTFTIAFRAAWKKGDRTPPNEPPQTKAVGIEAGPKREDPTETVEREIGGVRAVVKVFYGE